MKKIATIQTDITYIFSKHQSITDKKNNFQNDRRRTLERALVFLAFALSQLLITTHTRKATLSKLCDAAEHTRPHIYFRPL